MRSEEEELRMPDHTEMARELTGTGNSAQRPDPCKETATTRTKQRQEQKQ